METRRNPHASENKKKREKEEVFLFVYIILGYTMMQKATV